ncbi:c-type cytochrome [Kaistella palustris]|uniref:c-type cytochrome n=1 Tax=Kaistella palustris TaxID=493376 RepID=UPI000429E6B3|nr:c-type cytochrome [Kaistella palustris]
MNRIILGCALLAIVSCSKKEIDPNADSNVMLEEPVVSVVDSAAAGQHAGLALIEGGDCLTCHKMDAKLVGPSYQEVADKYTEADVDMLANKIIDGGAGNWGEIPMTPHSGMSKENAKKMVEYILTLKR